MASSRVVAVLALTLLVCAAVFLMPPPMLRQRALRRLSSHETNPPTQKPEPKSPYEISLDVCPHQTLTSLMSGTNVVLYDEIKASVIEQYEKLDHACDEINCEQADFAGCVLRMAGHDFMDFNLDSGFGGSDGCVDFDDGDNKGLKSCLRGQGEFGKGATLNEAYRPHCDRVSYADFIVVAAEAVMIRTRPDYKPDKQTSESLIFDFKFGRTTATSCSRQLGLPNPENGCADVDRHFNERLGLNSWRASAALMGVHTLGRARPANSGYEGWWVTGRAGRSFSNNYFKAMTAGWKPEKRVHGNEQKNQWRRDDDGPQADMMLDTDLCLFMGGKNLKAANAEENECRWSLVKPNGNVTSFCLDDNSKHPRADANFTQVLKACCGRGGGNGDNPELFAAPKDKHKQIDDEFISGGVWGPASQSVIDFAIDETAFLNEFKVAWKKVTENSLQVACADTGSWCVSAKLYGICNSQPHLCRESCGLCQPKTTTETPCYIVDCLDGWTKVGADGRGCGGTCQCVDKEPWCVSAKFYGICDSQPHLCRESCGLCQPTTCHVVDCPVGWTKVGADDRGCGGTCLEDNLGCCVTTGTYPNAKSTYEEQKKASECQVPVPSAGERKQHYPHKTCSQVKQDHATIPSCLYGKTVSIRSHRDQYLQDNRGEVKLSSNTDAWEQWTIIEAGNGKVLIKSHRSEHLQDNEYWGKVGLSSNTDAWERWTISDAGNGKVLIKSHRNKYLQDNEYSGKVGLSSNTEAWERWTISDPSGAALCL